MMYDSCNECPRNGTDNCPLGHRSQYMRQMICQFVRLPLVPFHNIDRAKITALPVITPREAEYSYTDFFHIAFDSGTPEQQARHLQNVLVSTAAIADFRKEDITGALFYIDSNGHGRAELPSEIKLRNP